MDEDDMINQFYSYKCFLMRQLEEYDKNSDEYKTISEELEYLREMESNIF